MPYTERTLYQWLRFHYRGPDVDLQRIETMAGAGVPDVNVCAHGKEFWLEGKVARYCRSYTNLRPDGHPSDRAAYEDALCFNVRRSQLAWMTKRRRAGGRCWFLVAVPKGLAGRLWPLTDWRTPVRLLALAPGCVQERMEERTGSLEKVTRLEARFGPQEVLKLNEWPLVESLLLKKAHSPVKNDGEVA